MSGAFCFLYLLLCLIIPEMYSQSVMSIWRSKIVCYYLATLYTSHYVFAGYCHRHNGLRYFFNSIKTFDSFHQLWTTLIALTAIKSFDSFNKSGRRGSRVTSFKFQEKDSLSVRVRQPGVYKIVFLRIFIPIKNPQNLEEKKNPFESTLEEKKLPLPAYFTKKTPPLSLFYKKKSSLF